MVQPLFCHLSDEEGRLGNLLDGDDEAGVGHPDVQPLPEDGLRVAHLVLPQVGDGQELLPVRGDQGQEGVAERVAAGLRACGLGRRGGRGLRGVPPGDVRRGTAPEPLVDTAAGAVGRTRNRYSTTLLHMTLQIHECILMVCLWSMQFCCVKNKSVMPTQQMKMPPTTCVYFLLL